MKIITGLGIGGLIAVAIACGGSSKAAHTTTAAPPTSVDAAGGMPGVEDTRTAIERLDAEITDLMGRLDEPRPTPPPDACVTRCDAQAMAGAATAATAADPTCKPGPGATCGESCKLKDSICTNAGKICSIAADLGGGDAFANDRCNRGTASCEAAKKRCCSCV